MWNVVFPFMFHGYYMFRILFVGYLKNYVYSLYVQFKK